MDVSILDVRGLRGDSQQELRGRSMWCWCGPCCPMSFVTSPAWPCAGALSLVFRSTCLRACPCPRCVTDVLTAKTHL